mgnify:CR=1 FL=1
MKLEPNKSVKIVVTQSKCNLLKEGGATYLKGPLIDYKNSASPCVTGLLGIYPWVMASRFGIESENMEWNHGYRVWCSEKLMKFKVVTYKNRKRGKVLRKG